MSESAALAMSFLLGRKEGQAGIKGRRYLLPQPRCKASPSILVECGSRFILNQFIVKSSIDLSIKSLQDDQQTTSNPGLRLGAPPHPRSYSWCPRLSTLPRRYEFW